MAISDCIFTGFLLVFFDLLAGRSIGHAWLINRWSKRVTVIGFESSLIRSLDCELSVPQIELIYLSRDHRVALSIGIRFDQVYPMMYIAVFPSLD